MPSSDRTLFLLDAMALIYRAFYALNKNPRINSKGMNTSAVLGFTNTLWDLLKRERPTHIGVAFDTMAPTVRHEGFIEYKANRQEMPEDLANSLPWIVKLIEAFRIPVLAVDGYEADDVIGTLAKRAESAGFLTYMMTSDKDFGQLVSENIFMYKPARMGDKPEIMGVKEVCNKYSLSHPEQMIDLLGLMGDASDNIPGIPGVGEVTAKKLLAEFGSVENLIANADKVSSERLRNMVKEHSALAMQSKELATIILDVPIEFDEHALLWEAPDLNALKALFDELEFKTLAQRIINDLKQIHNEGAEKKAVDSQPGLFSMEELPPAMEPVTGNRNNIRNTEHTYIEVSTEAAIDNLISTLKGSGSFCFDTETTGLDIDSAELVGISFSIKHGEAWYVPVPGDTEQANRIVSKFKGLFEDEHLEKTGQNLKFDMGMLKKYGIRINGKLFDTMLAHYLLQPEMRHNMDFLAGQYLDYDPVPIETLIGKKGRSQTSMRFADAEELKEYACEDADITLQLRTVFEPLLKENKLISLFEDVEVPLIHVLSAMEFSGIKIDTEALAEYSRQLGNDIRQLESEIHEMAGVNFNIASPKQMGEVLFERLKIIDNPRKTQTKQNSTAEDVLVKMVNKHPIIAKILEYRELSKLKSTYVDALPALVSPVSRRLHTSFNQAVTSTGRLSSNNPNLQNIPIRTEKGREIRKAFVPRDEGHTLVSADYSQIELRIIAALAKEEQMIEDFKQGLDIHAATASRVYGIPLSDVTREMRRNAKTVNFGIIYGISAFGLSERLSIPRKEAAEIIEQYFLKYPSIKKYMDQQVQFARENGYVETILGRKRYLKEIQSGNANIRGFAERNAINAPIQGSAADMIKVAMIRIYKEMEQRKLRSQMVLQVHDELVFDARLDELDILLPLIAENMKNAVALEVPIEVEISHGRNWLEAH
jgi:DNA polymerase-1